MSLEKLAEKYIFLKAMVEIKMLHDFLYPAAIGFVLQAVSTEEWVTIRTGHVDGKH